MNFEKTHWFTNILPKMCLVYRIKFSSGGGAFKKINEDEMESKVAGFALRGIGLPQPANASWNLKF